MHGGVTAQIKKEGRLNPSFIVMFYVLCFPSRRHVDFPKPLHCKTVGHACDIIGSGLRRVVTFYTQFRTKPVGKHLILLCQGTACHVNGSSDIEEAIREHLGVSEGEVTPDGLFAYNNVACLGCCSLAPAMMIGDVTYGMLTREKTVEILKGLEFSKNAH